MHRAGPMVLTRNVSWPCPSETKVAFKSAGAWGFPDGTALVQTLSLDRRAGKAITPFRVETRVLLRQQGEWAGYSYRWNAAQTDASLVAKKRRRRRALPWVTAHQGVAASVEVAIPQPVRVHGLPQPGGELRPGRDRIAIEPRS